jgi:hypothetical protein
MGKTIMNDKCPCCGHDITAPRPKWHKQSRTLLYKDRVLQFSYFRAEVFDIIWRATEAGEFVNQWDLLEEVYKGAKEPEDAWAAINVAITKMRASLQGIGLTLTKQNSKSRRPGGLYKVVEWEATQEEMAVQAMRATRLDSSQSRLMGNVINK